MVAHGFLVAAAAAVFTLVVKSVPAERADPATWSRSGLRPWVDVDTPESVYNITSSRGDTWTLVMSDEFNVAGRNFAPGMDHMWTALEMPDGVNAALEYYSINMTSTVTEPDGRGVFQIKTMEDENITYTVWNNYAEPAGFETHHMYYRAGMMQSWNKFCFQGGRMEVVAQLPAAMSSSNPDLKNTNGRVKTTEFYPTWPGIWLLGNLGRALFSQSTSRMWPWSYNECDKTLRTSQRISACDGHPGHGLNPYQGRGAPEIDLLEGAGNIISTSMQLAPGMPDDFRLLPPANDADQSCVYSSTCKTMGANFPGIPTKIYAARRHKTWYQGLRYAPNTLCTPMDSLKQDADTVIKTMKKGYTSNTCAGVNTCPASGDGYASLEPMDGNETRHWGINDVGGCMPLINGYTGAFLCDPDSSNPKCVAPLAAGKPGSNIMEPFEYQMDAISANWPVQAAAYTSYLKYQVEWVMGSDGYVRWMLEDIAMFEIPADAIETVPQDAARSNPKKIMLEEPMYVIFNVALSTSWGTTPPNPGAPCRGDDSTAQNDAICDGFPMYMKIDYIRVYQDLSPSSIMAIGCDPSTHPTKQWIEDHIDEYETEDNKVIEVHGGANCKHERDCTVSTSHIVTGTCNGNGRCSCASNAWGGPRCTAALTTTSNGASFGPPVVLATPVSIFLIVLFGFVAYKIACQQSRKAKVGAGVTRFRGFIKVEMDDTPISMSASDDGAA